MDQRLTGAGKLSRKVLTTLLTVGILSMGTCWAVDNSIYIDQSGSFGNITITQDGAGNTVKGLTSSGQAGQRTDGAIINGDNTQITISQIGSGNTLALASNGSTMVGYRDTTINYSATAQGSSALIQNIGASNLIGVTQTGNQSTVEARLNGSRSTISINAAGTLDAVSAINTGGDSSINIIRFSNELLQIYFPSVSKRWYSFTHFCRNSSTSSGLHCNCIAIEL